MPSSLLTDMDRGSTAPSLDDHRAIQLALELSMLGLDDDQNFDMRTKKSMNMTECVPVPSSEHVAEIVGRQGKSKCFNVQIIPSVFDFNLYMSLSICFVCVGLEEHTCGPFLYILILILALFCSF